MCGRRGKIIKLYGNDYCPSKLQSQHSAENLAGTEGNCKTPAQFYYSVYKLACLQVF